MKLLHDFLKCCSITLPNVQHAEQKKGRDGIMKSINNTKMLTYKQAMDYLGIKSYHTFYKLITKELPVIKIDSVKRIDLEDLESFIREHKTIERMK